MSADPLFLSKEQLKSLEEFAGLLFSLNEMDLMLGVQPGTLRVEMQFPDSDAAKAINRGRLKREATLRKVILQDAENGSSPTQNLSLELLKNRNTKDART